MSILSELKKAEAKLKCRGEKVYGMAISPKTQRAIQESMVMIKRCENVGVFYEGIPTIIDPRLGDNSQVYYDEMAWKVRCDEQREFDNIFIP